MRLDPFAVRVARGQTFLNLFVADDSLLFSINEQGPPRLQPPFPNDLVLRNVQYAHFRGHYDEIVVRYPVPGRPQAVPVQYRPYLHAIRERHRRRTVPGFHHARVILVKGLKVVRHRFVTGPRLGNQHTDGVRHVPPAADKQFEGLVEAGTVARARRQDGRQFLDIRT